MYALARRAGARPCARAQHIQLCCPHTTPTTPLNGEVGCHDSRPPRVKLNRSPLHRNRRRIRVPCDQYRKIKGIAGQTERPYIVHGLRTGRPQIVAPTICTLPLNEKKTNPSSICSQAQPRKANEKTRFLTSTTISSQLDNPLPRNITRTTPSNGAHSTTHIGTIEKPHCDDSRLSVSSS